MEFFPELKLGWFNGWLPVTLLGILDSVHFLAFPREVVQRLFDRSGWSKQQQVLTLISKISALACIILFIFTPLKIGHVVFYIGMSLVVTGLIGVSSALITFRRTPLNEPVMDGLYRISRHPQIVMASVVLLGTCLAIGSWTALGLFALARGLSHASILAEEAHCLENYGESYKAYLEDVPRYFLFF